MGWAGGSTTSQPICPLGVAATDILGPVQTLTGKRQRRQRQHERRRRERLGIGWKRGAPTPSHLVGVHPLEHRLHPQNGRYRTCTLRDVCADDVSLKVPGRPPCPWHTNDVPMSQDREIASRWQCGRLEVCDTAWTRHRATSLLGYPSYWPCVASLDVCVGNTR
jgi:hypothetical protein